MRVVTLLPSATEIVLALASIDAISPKLRGQVQLVGVSHECDWPPEVQTAVQSGTVAILTGARTVFQSAAQVDRDVREHLASGQSLYTLDTYKLAALKPDVIVTQDLCEVCSIDLTTVRAAAAEMTPRPTIVSLDPQTFEGVLDDVLTVGAALGLERRATELIVALRDRIYRAEEHVNPFVGGPSVAFLEWTDPLFIGGHWTPQLIERAGGSHPLNPTVPIHSAGAAAGPVGQTLRRAGKSTPVTPEQLVGSQPEALVVAPCGLSLAEARREAERFSTKSWWSNLPAVRAGRVAVVDGNQMFNRPGPRLVDAFEFLVGWLNERSALIPRDFPWIRLDR